MAELLMSSCSGCFFRGFAVLLCTNFLLYIKFLKMTVDKSMNPVLAGFLILMISLFAILPAFPVLGILQNNFPELPCFYNIDQLAKYVVKAAFIFVVGMVSMCVYSDFACPIAIKGYHFVFSRM